MAGKDRYHQRNGVSIAQSNGNLTMHDYDRAKQIRDSTENRLRRDVTDLENQETNSILSIRRDQRLLKEKLFTVQQSTGHYDGRNKKAKSRRKIRLKDGIGDRDGLGMQRKMSGLPSLVITDNEKNKSNETVEEVVDKELIEEELDLRSRSKSLEKDSQGNIAKDAFTLPMMSKFSKSENTLNNAAWYTNIDEVRSTIKQRLSLSTNDLSKSSPEKELEPYLYAPPDGLPRTMYLMPSMDERFKQAMKARYIRKPGTKINPIERELNIKEIFDSSNYKK